MPAGAEHARHRRHQNPRDAELAGQLDREHRAVAAERHQGHVARIAAALDRDGADRARHRDGRDLADAVGRVDRRNPRAVRRHDAGSRPRCAPGRPAARAAGEPARVEEAEQQVGVGDGRPIVAAAVAGRPGIGAGGFRPDQQQAAWVHGGQRAAARSDLGDVDRRHLEEIAAALDEAAGRAHALAELVFGGQRRHAVVDDRRLGGRAAHVEHDDVAVADHLAEPGGARDARRPGPRRPRNTGRSLAAAAPIMPPCEATTSSGARIPIARRRSASRDR